MCSRLLSAVKCARLRVIDRVLWWQERRNLATPHYRTHHEQADLIHLARPLVITGAFSVVLFFFARGVLAHFPRFYLAYLLLFNGLSFLCENFLNSRMYITRTEFVVPFLLVFV